MEPQQLFTVISLFVSVSGYGTYVPASRCESMIPGHGSASSGTQYSLSVSDSTYTPGATLTVSISGSSFQGVLLQARLQGTTTVVGAFSNFPSNTMGITCTHENGAVSHSATTSKPDGTSFTWNVPSDLTSDIVFRATVAQQKMTWWTGITSETVSRASVSTTAAVAASTATTSSPTPADNSQADQSTSSASSSFFSSSSSNVNGNNGAMTTVSPSSPGMTSGSASPGVAGGGSTTTHQPSNNSVTLATSSTLGLSDNEGARCLSQSVFFNLVIIPIVIRELFL